MDYDELFKATLSMFALDASGGESSFRNLEPTTIQTLFKKVLEANKLTSRKIYNLLRLKLIFEA